MQATRHNALWRALTIYAKFIQKPKPARTKALGDLPKLTPHIARDIGLSEQDHARLTHQWPSQTNRHPYL